MLNRRLILSIILAVISGMAAVGDDGVVIFEKTLPSGRVATVITTTKHKKGQQLKNIDPPVGAPREMAVIGGAPMRIDNCIMRIRDKKGTDVIAWQKEQSWDELFPREIENEITIHDIAEKEDQIAILFSEDNTEIEILGQSENKGFEIRWKRSLMPRPHSSDPIRAGRLSWLEDLYVLTTTNAGGAGVWRARKNELVKIFNIPNYYYYQFP